MRDGRDTHSRFEPAPTEPTREPLEPSFASLAHGIASNSWLVDAAKR